MDAHLGTLALSVLVLLFSLTVHEAAHAWAADRLGDATARRLGRLSLNPLVHLDLVGTVLVPAVALATGAPLIGWAKPVPVHPARLGRPRRDLMAVAAAGPASNLLLALAAALAIRLSPPWPAAAGPIAIAEPLSALAAAALQVNLLLAVFNLLPLPPLDGSAVVGGLLPAPLAARYERIRPYGIFILYALVFTGALERLIAPPYLLLARLLTL
jgi:Zn-dependent protease